MFSAPTRLLHFSFSYFIDRWSVVKNFSNAIYNIHFTHQSGSCCSLSSLTFVLFQPSSLNYNPYSTGIISYISHLSFLFKPKPQSSTKNFDPNKHLSPFSLFPISSQPMFKMSVQFFIVSVLKRIVEMSKEITKVKLLHTLTDYSVIDVRLLRFTKFVELFSDFPLNMKRSDRQLTLRLW